MTYITFKTILENKFTQNLYKLGVIFYSFYFLFSSQAFALQAEAPTGQSFKNLVIEEIIGTEEIIDGRPDKIRRYYERYNLPLAEYAEEFVLYADKYDIDWTLLAAIGFIESTGGKFACKTVSYSAFGWGSCKINFDSYEESIDIITKNIAGKNPKMAYYYADKDIRGILEAYNPPSIVPDYADKVMREMDIIKAM